MEDVLRAAELYQEDIDLFMLHQATDKMLASCGSGWGGR